MMHNESGGEKLGLSLGLGFGLSLRLRLGLKPRLLVWVILCHDDA